MALAALQRCADDPLSCALVAAEIGEPFDLARAPSLIDELLAAVPALRACVPYATVRLVARLARDERADVRARVARALPCFVDLYPQRVDELLLELACDPARRVRAATANALAEVLLTCRAPDALVERWESYPDRARDVLARARRAL
jgi:hypothetical protein